MWHDELGIDMELRQEEWKVYFADENKLNYDLTAQAGLAITTIQTRSTCSPANNGNNRTGWKNARY